jgi:hypothetical protein
MAELKGKILAGKILIKPSEAEEKPPVVSSFLIQQRRNHSMEQ